MGFDVSPPCILLARQIANEEGLERMQCSFCEVDATMDPERLLEGKSVTRMRKTPPARDRTHSQTLQQPPDTDGTPLAGSLKSTTVIFLYTYPTLLVKLIPLLACLTEFHNVRAVVTSTYHLPEDQVETEQINSEHDFRLYSKVYSKSSV